MMAGSVLVGDREAAFAEAIAAQEYLRERLEPRPGIPSIYAFRICLSQSEA